jgi:hypothetical protein
MVEYIGVAGDAELPPAPLTCVLVFGITENSRSFHGAA